MDARMTRTQALEALAHMTDEDFPTDVSGEELSPEQYASFISAGRSAGRPTLGTTAARSPQITFRLPEELLKSVREHAEAEHVTVSQWTRRIVEREIAAV